MHDKKYVTTPKKWINKKESVEMVKKEIILQLDDIPSY